MHKVAKYVSDKKTRKSDYYLINYVNETNNIALIEFDWVFSSLIYNISYISLLWYVSFQLLMHITVDLFKLIMKKVTHKFTWQWYPTMLKCGLLIFP